MGLLGVAHGQETNGMPTVDRTRRTDTVCIGDVTVELPPVAELRHACDPGICRGRRSCCAEYEVRVDEAEVSRIAGLMPNATAYVPSLKSGGQIENVFDGLGHEICAIETDEEGLCVLAYRDPEGGVRCSLHSAAAELGLDPYAAKPEACSLWPLAIVDTHPIVLSVQPGAYGFPCNSRRPPPFSALDPGVRRIVHSVFGNGFAHDLEEAVREWSRIRR
jgi:hypothetical protein